MTHRACPRHIDGSATDFLCLKLNTFLRSIRHYAECKVARGEVELNTLEDHLQYRVYDFLI